MCLWKRDKDTLDCERHTRGDMFCLSSILHREAEVRGKENPIFTGALGIWDHVILHDHEYVCTCQAATNFYGSGNAFAVRAYRALLMGRQSVVFANCQYKNKWVEEQFDYKDKVGFATGVMGGFQKVTFNSKDYGVISVDTAATDLA